jgi:carboxypeptidase C (cathepsin A)
MSDKVENSAPYQPWGEETRGWRIGVTASVSVLLLIASGTAALLSVSSSSALLAMPDPPTKPDKVQSLPGLASPLLETHYAGFVTVKETAGNHLFYWFVESARVVQRGEAAADVPLLIWLNGGPGASSLTGLLAEGVGPYTLQADGMTLLPNPFSWHRMAHVLIWDQPVGAGFAYTERADGFVSSMPQMATQLLAGLRAFFALHPQYASSPLFVTGESFAGKYIPAFCAHIHRENAKRIHPPIHLVGAAIGNGVLKPWLQYAALPELALALGYATERSAT